MSSIEAKPTEYKGTLYRSRLEARWAVYLDHHPNVLSPKYEPTTFYFNHQPYTPDYYFFLRGCQGYHLEVKPALPSQDFLWTLLRIMSVNPCHILLAVGDFYNGEPEIYDLKRHLQSGTVVVGDSLSSHPLGDNYALTSAAGYRFDLAQPEPPRKKGRKVYDSSKDEWIQRSRANRKRKR